MGQIRVNFKSDFKLRLKSEASWAVPFRVVFFTSNYSEGHVAWYDGKEYHGCRVDEDGVLVVGVDNPSLGLGPLKMEVAYYESDKDFADGVDATVVAPMAVVDDEGNSYVITAGGLSGVDVVATLPTPGPRGEKGDKGDKGDTFVYDDLSEEDKDDIALRAGADVLAANEAAREKAEEEREKAESGRVKAENARETAESGRVSAENARVSAENARKTAESSRAAAESARVTAESGRVSAENARKTAESSRAAAESARVTAENARKDAEVLREVAEVKRAAAEAGRAEELASKAVKVGYEPKLKVRYSEELVGRGEAVSQEIGKMRPTGEISIGDGNATITEMRGRSVVWNQWADMSNLTTTEGMTVTYGQTVTLTEPTPKKLYSNASAHVHYVEGHKYLMYAVVKVLQASPRVMFRADVSGASTSMFITETSFYDVNAGEIIEMHGIGSPKKLASYPKAHFRIYPYFTSDAAYSGATAEILEFNVHDLTQMFGAGNEPTTIEEFEARKPLGVTNDYNEGEIVSFDAQALKSVGFNAWNGEYAKVIGGMEYRLEGTFTSIGFTNELGGEQTAITVADDRVYTPSEDGYIYAKGTGVCIHLKHTYTPERHKMEYEEDVFELPDIKGIKDKDGNQLFPYGLLSAGNVHDEITATKAVKRVGVVDMGTKSWTTPKGSIFFTSLSDVRTKYNTLGDGIISERYLPTSASAWGNMADKSVGASNTRAVSVKDTSYTDATTFKQAMQGVMLYYELATPIEVDLPEPLNMTYEAWDFGTEELVAEGATTQLNADIAYQFNAVDRIRENSAYKADKTEVEKIEKKVDALMSLHELEELAFYIDINTASALGSTRVDVGGNLMMRSMWENAKKPILMDRDGNYIELNPNDCRYTAEGEYLLKENGTIIDKYSHCDMMELIPEYYGYVQTVTVGETTKLLPWFSLVPLRGGYVIPQQVVGKFKSGNVGSEMRSLPGLTPDNTKTINEFWYLAQKRSANHGLANLDFRNYMLFHVMSKYGYRDVQNAVGADGTKVFGVGLDGTESKGSDKFTDQRYIKTGSTLTLGDNDGNVPVTDNNGGTVHSVSVCGFENPYGQYWEMVQGLCSVGTDVYHWRGNVMPTGTPTAETFAEIPHTLLMRPTTTVWGMNIISSEDNGQGVYMIPKESVSGISYGDYFSYSETGQLWIFGGRSDSGARCGLAYAYSDSAWSHSYAGISARLAYYGSVRKVSSTELSNK